VLHAALPLLVKSHPQVLKQTQEAIFDKRIIIKTANTALTSHFTFHANIRYFFLNFELTISNEHKISFHVNANFKKGFPTDCVSLHLAKRGEA